MLVFQSPCFLILDYVCMSVFYLSVCLCGALNRTQPTYLSVFLSYTYILVFVASLDISKAFDTVNHYKLFKSLLRAGIPVMFVDLLCDWYSKLSFAVRWNGAVSPVFCR